MDVVWLARFQFSITVLVALAGMPFVPGHTAFIDSRFKGTVVLDGHGC